MQLASALDFARANNHSVLTTIRANGRPQLSNMVHLVGSDDTIRMSITTGRAKYVNLQRVPWAAVHVTRADFYAYVVIEGDVELSAPAAEATDASVEELVAYYRAAAGEHPDWDDYRATMVAEGRLIARIIPTRAYGMLPS